MTDPRAEFKKGLNVRRIGKGKFRIELSVGFGAAACDFSRTELESFLADAMSELNLDGFNKNPTKENIDIVDEEARA